MAQIYYMGVPYGGRTTGGGSGDAYWGNIGGVLANQTDLKTALDAKSAVTANPTLEGGESDLSSIEIDGTKYGISGGGGSPYVLPQATASALGGIKASPKTGLETNEVKIDESTGKLYSRASSTGSGITEDEAKALIFANEYRWEAKEGTIHCGALFSNNIMDLSTKGYPYTCLEYTFDGHETKVRLSADAGGSNSNHAYCFVDSNNNILLTDEWSSGATYKNLVLDVPSGSYKLYVNGTGSTSAHLEVGYVDHVSDPHTGLYVLKHFGKKLQYKDAFAWKPMPTGLIALTFDDSLGELSDLVDYATEKGVPICFGCIPERLNATTEAGDETIAQAMHRQINSTAGGEVLAHGGYIITEENIDNYEYLYEKFVIYKQKLLDAGFDVRGIVRTGGSEHGYENIENDPRTDVWVRLFFDYSDAYGVAEPYNHYRFSGSSEADYKNAVDNAITQKRFMPLLFHSAPDFLDDLVDYIEEQGGQIVTYADVYDTYGSNAETVDILRRITALEGGSTPTLSSISATKTTTAYSVGDTLSTADITVTATYSDTSSGDVTSSAVINTNNVDMSTAGTYAINVSYTYGGTTATTTISITVSAVAKVLDSISAVKSVTSYAVGATLSTADITVTAHYTDSTSATVAGTYDTSNVNMNTAGTYSIGVSYTENGVTKTTSVSITVTSVSYIIDHDTATGTSISDGEFVGSTFTSVSGHTYHVEFDYSFDVTATQTVNSIDVKGGAWWDATHYALQLSRVQTGTVSGHASADIPCGTSRTSGDYGSNALRFALNNLSIGNYSITNLCVWEV